MSDDEKDELLALSTNSKYQKAVKRLFQGSQNKMDKVEAIQKAQLEVMKTKEYEHPYYWAPFILVGDWK